MNCVPLYENLSIFLLLVDIWFVSNVLLRQTVLPAFVGHTGTACPGYTPRCGTDSQGVCIFILTKWSPQCTLTDSSLCFASPQQWCYQTLQGGCHRSCSVIYLMPLWWSCHVPLPSGKNESMISLASTLFSPSPHRVLSA